jgi:shikimate dehydrogenase
MNSSPSVKIYGLIGYHLGHSLSPVMHNAAFKELNIPGKYELFEIPSKELDIFFQNLDKENIHGLNVTVPYKERVLRFIELDQESAYLKQIRAVNTIVKHNNIWKGFNTDIPGFGRHLNEVFDSKNKSVALLGAGGAARAVVYALIRKGAKEIAIYDIDKEKCASIAEMVKKLFSGFDISVVQSIEALDIKNKDLLINATPVGLKQEDPCLVGEDMLHKDIFVYDLIYNPAETKLLALAKERGAKCSNGLGMLIYQAALSFVHFTGTDASLDSIINIMRKALG